MYCYLKCLCYYLIMNVREFYSENRGLKLLLSVILVVIVGLAGGIVGVSVLGGNDDFEGNEYDDGYDRASLESDCADGDDYNSIMLCIENDYFKTKDLAQAIERYNKVIEDKITKEDWTLAASLITSEFNFYYRRTGNCDVSFEMLRKWDLADFPDDAKASIYSDAVSLSRECENVEENEYWDSLYNTTMENNYGAIDEE